MSVSINDPSTAQAVWDQLTPAAGIPATDLAASVQTSLGKADAALQPGTLPAGTTLPVAQISDATAAGRAVLTAASASAQRTAMGAMVATLAGWQAAFDAAPAAEKAVAQASVSGAGVAQAMTALICGDSLGAENGPEVSGGFLKTWDIGWFNWLQKFSQQAFSLVGNVAVRGKRSDEILSEQLAAIRASSARVVFMVCPGANDVIQGVAASVTTAANQSLFDAISASGRHIVLLSSFPLFRLALADNIKFEAIAAHARSYAATSRSMTYIDARRVLMDPLHASMYARSGYLRNDNTHLTPRAARLLGKFVWDELAARGWRSNAYHVTSTSDVRGTIAGAPNRVRNPLMTGTAGTLNAGYTGSCPTGMQWYTTTGTISGACSIAARADGYGNNAIGNITAGAANSEFAFRTNDLMRDNISGGETLRGELYISASGVSGLRRLRLGLIVNVGGANYAVYENDFGADGVSQVDQTDFSDLCFRTPPLTLPAGVVSAANLVCEGFFETTGGGTFSFGRASVF